MSRTLRIAIVYDRVFPASYGGAERWFRLLADNLIAAGHQVTYLTSQHWPDQLVPKIPGVDIRPIFRPPTSHYAGARRSVAPVAGFGLAVAAFLARHGRRFDVVHTTAMAPAAAHACLSASRFGDFVVAVDWWELWQSAGWRAYLGDAPGRLAARAEARLARSRHLPVVYSQLHAARLRALRGRDDALLLRGVLPPATVRPTQPAEPPYVLLVNRLIPEKQTAAIVPAVALARQRVPNLHVIVVGTGPDEPELRALARAMCPDGAISFVGNVDDDELHRLMQGALCVSLLSRREGYGLVTAEALAFGTPALVLRHPDSSAAELVAEGENGFVCETLDPDSLASAILRLHAAGQHFRDQTAAWRQRHEDELSIAHSLPLLTAHYEGGIAERRTGGWHSARR